MFPVMLPFYKDHVGIGYQGMLIGEAVFAASSILFDVPTSWISDNWRRKHSLALGAAFIFLALCIFGLAKNIWAVIACNVVWGIGYSLLNGTNTALIYDSLLVMGREKEFQKWDGRRLACSLYGTAVAGTIGGYAYEKNNFLPIYLSLLFHVLAFCVVIFMQEPDRHRKMREKHPVADILRTIKYVLRGHADLGVIIGLAASIFCATKLIMFSQQPYFMAAELPIKYYGILMAVGWGLGGLSGHFAYLLEGKANIFLVLAASLFAALFVCIGAASHIGGFGIFLLMLGGTCIYGIISPRVNEAVNKSVGSDRRATALSTTSLVYHMLFIPLSLMIGWISDNVGVRWNLIAIAAWLIFAGTCTYFAKTPRRT